MPPDSRIVSEVVDPSGDGALYLAPGHAKPVAGADLLAASATLELAPREGEPRLVLKVRLAPSPSDIWSARIAFALDLDSTASTPSYANGEGCQVRLEPGGRAHVSRGVFGIGNVPVTYDPPWGSGRVGQTVIEVTVPLSWLQRRTSPFSEMGMSARTWHEWLGRGGRPLSWRVTVVPDARGVDRSDALPDLNLPPARLPVPRR